MIVMMPGLRIPLPSWCRKVALVATPKFDQDARNGKPAWRLGLGRQMKPERLDPISALEYGVHDTWSIITQTLQYIGNYASGTPIGFDATPTPNSNFATNRPIISMVSALKVFCS